MMTPPIGVRRCLRPAKVAVRVGLATLVVGCISMMPAAAQQESPDSVGSASTPSATFSIEEVTPWVAADGEWRVRFKAPGAPPDSLISYIVREPLGGTEPTTRSQMSDALADGSDRTVLRRSTPAPLTSLTGPDAVAEIRFQIRPQRANDDRVYIPNRGSYPIDLVLTAADRSPIAKQTVFLNRMPATSDPKTSKFKIALLVTDSSAGYEDGAANVTNASSAESLDSATALATAGRDLPITPAINPSTLVALSGSASAVDRESVTGLSQALGTTPVVRRPWTTLDVEGWARINAKSALKISLTDGVETLFTRLRVPVENRFWPVDPTVGPDALKVLGQLGVTAIAVDSSQLVPARIPTTESGFTRPFRLTGSDGSSMTAFQLDPKLQADLTDSDTGRSTALSVHEMITQMFAAWMSDDVQRGALIQTTASIDNSRAKELVRILDSAKTSVAPSPFTVVTAIELFNQVPRTTFKQRGTTTDLVRAIKAPAKVSNVQSTSRLVAEVRPLVDDYSAVMPNGDTTANDYAVSVRRALGNTASPTAQDDRLRTIQSKIRADLDKITAPANRSITVTARQRPLPIQFENSLGKPVRVRLRLTSPRLRFPEGNDKAITLEPGLNRLDIPVEVRSSGEFTMRVELLTPNSDRLLTLTRYRIQSRVFSGVGLMLSGGALLFLVYWWSHTLRKGRDLEDDKAADGTGNNDPSDPAAT